MQFRNAKEWFDNGDNKKRYMEGWKGANGGTNASAEAALKAELEEYYAMMSRVVEPTANPLPYHTMDVLPGGIQMATPTGAPSLTAHEKRIVWAPASVSGLIGVAACETELQRFLDADGKEGFILWELTGRVVYLADTRETAERRYEKRLGEVRAWLANQKEMESHQEKEVTAKAK